MTIEERADRANPIGSGAGGSRTHREILQSVEQVLDESVRAELRSDGGDVVVVGLDPDNILQVRFLGACQGCASSVVTLGMRIEAVLKRRVPEVRFVEAVP